MFGKNLALGIMFTMLISPLIFETDIQSARAELLAIVVPASYPQHKASQSPKTLTQVKLSLVARIAETGL